MVCMLRTRKVNQMTNFPWKYISFIQTPVLENLWKKRRGGSLGYSYRKGMRLRYFYKGYVWAFTPYIHFHCVNLVVCFVHILFAMNSRKLCTSLISHPSMAFVHILFIFPLLQNHWCKSHRLVMKLLNHVIL